MKKTSLLLCLGVVGFTTLGCREGRRGVEVRGPYHDVEVGYDVQEDEYGHHDVDLVHEVEHR